MLPVFGRPCEGQPDTQSPERGVTTVEHDQTSGCLCVERHVWLLRDPDAMQQDGKLACDCNDGSVTRLFATARRQVQAPLSQRRVFSRGPRMWLAHSTSSDRK
jgi:hypothetical protein